MRSRLSPGGVKEAPTRISASGSAGAGPRATKQARGRTPVLPAAPAGLRTHKVPARVIDTTSAVRSPAVRDLTCISVTWTVMH
ncbi:hypothetical protein [Streptomyces sp. 067-1]|uniref:hypothetical protein n=1 Tax=Streptomyces sp. 067-1 TaxID=2789269 RepID=UPI0039F5A0EE